MKTKLTIIPSFLPVFTGFYSTIYEPDSDCSDNCYSQGLRTGFDWTDYFDNAQYQIDTVIACCETIQGWLKGTGIERVEYEKIVSPAYYNFQNDAVDVKYHVDLAIFAPFIKKFIDTNAGLWDEYLLRYKSRDGFMSYYSHEADVWAALTQNWTKFIADDDAQSSNRRFFSHLIGTLLEFYLTCNTKERSLELYYAVQDSVSPSNYLNIPKSVIKKELKKDKKK